MSIHSIDAAAAAYAIEFDRETKDFRVTVDDAYIGHRRTYHDGEELAREHISDLLASGITRTARELDGGTEEGARQLAIASLDSFDAITAEMRALNDRCMRDGWTEADGVRYRELSRQQLAALHQANEYLAKTDLPASCTSCGDVLPDGGPLCAACRESGERALAEPEPQGPEEDTNFGGWRSLAAGG